MVKLKLTFKHPEIKEQLEQKIKTLQSYNKPQIISHQKKPPIPTCEFLDLLRILRIKFPLAFPKKTRVVLKIGIDKEIKEELNISKTKARKFLYWYTNGNQYIAQHKQGAPRYNLKGEIVDYVTTQQEFNKTKEIKSTNIITKSSISK